jgi:hypothetical protein
MSTLSVIEIPAKRYTAESGKRDLDPVTAFLRDFEPGRGELTLVCYGRAWTIYWGSMGNGADLRSFILHAWTGYIVGKLMLPYDVMLKRAEQREQIWLTDIVESLKEELRKEPTP